MRIEFYHVDAFEAPNYEPIWRALRELDVDARLVAVPGPENTAASGWFDFDRLKSYYDARGVPFFTSTDYECPAITTQNKNILRHYSSLHIRLSYAPAVYPDSWNYREITNRPFDAVLVHGFYDVERISKWKAKDEILIIGYPRYDDFFAGRIDSNVYFSRWCLDRSRPTIVYLPTWEKRSSIDSFLDKVSNLASEFNVVIKPHHCTLRMEPRRAAMIEQSGLTIVQDAYDLPALFSVADLVIADTRSGAFFESVMTDRPTIGLAENHAEIGQWLEPYGITRLAPICTEQDNLRLVANHLLEKDTYKSARRQWAERSVSFRDGTAAQHAADEIMRFVERKQKRKTPKISQISTPADSGEKSTGLKRKKRNIIWICIDGLRPDKLLSCGNDKRPRLLLDDLLTSGVLFENMFTVQGCSKTSSHATFTSMYGASNGVNGYAIQNLKKLDPSVISLTDHLKRVGYKTFRYCDRTDPECNAIPKSGFDVWESSGYLLLKETPNYSFDVKERDEFIQLYNETKGLKFAFIHLVLLHDQAGDKGGYFWTSEMYEGFIENQSDDLALVLDKFKFEPDDLLVLFTDHGIDLDRHRLEETKKNGVMLEDGHMRVFCSFIADDIAPQKVNQLVRTIDIAPTILDIVGAGPMGAQGVSLLPLIQGKSLLPLQAYMARDSTYEDPPWSHSPCTWGVRTDRWKYVTHKWRKDCEWLIDLGNDPDYTNNLIGKGLEIENTLRDAVYKTLIDNPKKPLEIYAENNLDFSRQDIKPVTSVIIPVVRATPHLKDSIESLLAQIGPYFELIIVDGEETEDTGQKILELYREYPHVHYHRLKQRSLQEILNFGSQAAKGRYFVWVSPEVIYEDDFLYKLKKDFDHNPESGLTNSDARRSADAELASCYGDTAAEHPADEVVKNIERRQETKSYQAPSCPSCRVPKVSVVLPTYNHLKFLPKAIESVLAQTYDDFELIIVNDGSTDGTREYLDSLKDPRITVIHQENKRLPEALNTGFRTAHGELLTWISSDNYCAPMFLEKFVSAMDANPNAGLAYSAFARIDEHDQIIKVTRCPDMDYSRFLLNFPGMASFMYRRICQEKVGLYDPALKCAEDWDMWLRIAEQFGVIYVPDILYYYRKHSESLTAQKPDMVFKSSQRAFQNAVNRLRLESLYPSLGHCKDQATAKFHAWFDFGTVLVHSKYGLQTGAACKFLEKALSLRPDSIEVAGNLAVAYALSEQWEKVVPLVRRILKDAQSPKFLGICRPILEAYKTNNPKLLLSAHLFEVDKNNSELFQLEQERERSLSGESKMVPETSSSDNIDKRDSGSVALNCFLKAKEEFDRGNFVTAIKHIEEYKSLMDYSKLPRTLNTRDEDDDVAISVIIVTYNRTDDLKKCLESLSKQDGVNCNFEVIVVDNGQSDVNSCSQYINQYIKCPINFNPSEGRNIGVHFAKGKIIVFLDDDALVDSNYISSVESAFDKFDIFGLRGRAYPKNSPATNDHVNIYDLGDRPFPSYCNQEGNSAFLLEVYKSMGGMDPLLFGHEGSDLTYRIIKEHKHANKIIYWPETIIYHDYGTEDKCRQKKRIHQQSANYLKYKHDSDIFVNRRDIEKYPLPLKQNQKLLDKDSSAQVGLLSRKTQFNRESAKAPELPNGKSADIISAASVSHRHPKVSIVVSCHNSEKFLPECLDSIRNQTMQDWELFLLDDASTDGTTSIIEKYSRMNKRIKPHYFQDNKGPYVRRNFAMERAGSDFIIIQDADDIMVPSKLEVLYNAITSDERLGVVGSFYQKFLDEFRGFEYADRIELPITHDEIMGHYCSARYVCWHGSAIIRKSMFEMIGLYDEHPYGSDKLWLAKAAEYARYSNEVRFKNIPEYLTLKREHPLSQQGLLPTLDPRSRRARFQVYWEYKLAKIQEKLQNEPITDLAAELRSCDCSDYIERFGYMFEQWESEPLDDEHLHGFISKGIREFCIAEYASCIITLNSVQRMVGDVTEKFRNYDLLWGLANFALDRKEQCEFHIKREIKQHYNPKAEQFLNKYLNDSDAAGQLTASERGVIIKRVIFGSDDKKLCVAGEADDTIVRRTYNLREAAQPRLSIIIVASGNRTELLETLSALNNQSDNRFETIVIDSVPDETFEAQHVADKPAYGLSVIELAQKTSTILAKNIGIYRAKGDYVAFLAEDAVPDRGLVGNIISHFENSNVSGLRGRILSKSGVYKPEYYDPGDRAVCNGCDTDEICAFRRDILVEVGGFTENLYGNESLELSCRIYEARQRDIESVMYFPDVIVYRRAYSSEQEYTGRMFIEERLRYEQIKEMAVQKSPQMLAYLDFSQRLYPSKMRKHENHYYWLVNNSLLLQERCPEEAVVWAEKAVSLEPEVVEGRYMLGLVYVSLGKYSEAQQQLEPILAPLIQMLECGQTTAHGSDLKPAVCYVDTCTKLAQCYMKQGKYDKLKQISTHLLNNPHIKLPEQQRTAFCALLAKLEKSRPPAPVSKPALSSPTIGTDQQPLVSVIIPAYNAERYVAETIKSVLNQSYKNFELVVVNDGSIDQTKDIVLSFQDERIKYLYQENRGLASAYNVGIKNSKGNFLIKLDSDDMMTPDFIVRHLVEFRGHPEADLVYCDDYLIDEEGKPIRVIERPEYSDRKSLIRDLFRCGFPVVPFRTCIRRGVFDKIGFFDEDLQMAEDYDMMRRFVKNGLKIHHLKGALYLRRMTSDSLSRNFTAEKTKSHFDVVKRFTETFTYDELFPDVAWDKIAPERRQLHAECLAGVTYLAIGQTYVKTNSPIYAKTAFGHACSELNNCLKMDPGNQRIRQLLQKCEFSRQKYDEEIRQAVR